MMSTVLGIDIGGTRTIIAPGDESGLLEEPESIETDRITSSSSPPEYLAGIIQEYDDYNFRGIGVGAAGAVNRENLAVEQSANWSGLGFKELVQHLEIDEDHFFLENDTDASLLGEKNFGLESEGDIGYLNYGTGIGGSIWKDEHLIRGLEPGFWNVNHEVELEHGGVLNPVEAFCSGTGIEMFLERKMEDIDNSDWQTGFSEVSEDNISPESFFEAVRGYEDFALDIYAEIKDINTQLLGGLTNNYGVDIFIFGGSVVYNNSFLIDYEYGDVSKEDSMQDPDIGEDKYLKHTDNEIFLEDRILDWRPSPELKFSELGEYSVLYGAIATTLQNIETEL